jgi:hypothetical protein
MPAQSSPRIPRKKWSTASPTFSSTDGDEDRVRVDHPSNDSSTRPTGYNSDTESESPSGQSGQSGHSSTGGGSVSTRTSAELGLHGRCCETTTCVRWLFFIVLISTAVALATAIYFVLSDQEKDDFETEVRMMYLVYSYLHYLYCVLL